MKIALFLSLAAINFSCSKALAENRDPPIRVATISYIESLNKDHEIGIDHINLIQDLTLLSFARNSIQYYSGDNAKIECINSMKNLVGGAQSIITCRHPTQLLWSFSFLFSDADYEIYQISLSVKEAVSLRREFQLDTQRVLDIPIHPDYATVWNRNTLIFCPANVDSWENCNTNIITTTRKLLTHFDKTH
ncbi:hypothetical protein SAMN02745753_03484 [Marinomonas polaris DSM 16579]|uniref:Uncharacterized protein n=1 Tax=Marinomonas polaris DSM 16579 TaxID=1122206 RepID=A0A1M5I2I6_9GAMM|nr:hypothetical protein [Marinomonas polaris]SHG22367.1 hypothetical protein SAMN02745753_03484 [Marinomonas polaris DSM 16579]